jgi:hypothetical protein
MNDALGVLQPSTPVQPWLDHGPEEFCPAPVLGRCMDFKVIWSDGAIADLREIRDAVERVPTGG